MTSRGGVQAHGMMRRRQRFHATPYLLILPSLAIIVAFLIIPILQAVMLTFTNTSLLTRQNAKFIGLKNYIDFFTGSNFGRVFVATFVYVVGGVAFTYVFGLFTAAILHNNFVGRGLARTLLIMPWVVPQVVLVIVWKWMFNPKYGVINFLLSSIRLVPTDFSWFSSATFGMSAILITTVWKQYPLALLILLAGMQSISKELYEAASVDGANPVQKFIRITMPGLRYVTTVLVLLLTVWHFGNFVIVWLMTQGGPANSTATLTIFTYLNAFKFDKLGFGATVGIIALLISLIFSGVYYRLFVRGLAVE
jgi:multiple sugar transport system permease protein